MNRTIKTIDRLTRSKKLIRVCHEHYLRDDISSGTSLIDGEDLNITLPLSEKPFGTNYVVRRRVCDISAIIHSLPI